MNVFLLLADSPATQTELVENMVEAVEAATASIQTSPAAGSPLMLLLTIFVLSVFVGVEIIAKIPPTLHTPLMSGSNAISGITLVGAILAGGTDAGTLATVLGMLSIILATINVVGGFVVTHRMLSMFRSRK